MFKPFHTYNPDCDKIRFVLDTETLSLEKNAAVVDIALVEIAGNDRQFNMQIQPSWYENHGLGFDMNAGTVEFHKKNNPNFLVQCEQFGQYADLVVGALYDFLVSIQEMEQKEVLLYMQGTDFDKPILEHLFKHFDTELPVHYRNVRDLRTLTALTPEVKYIPGNHTALDDARHSCNHLLKQAAMNGAMFKYLWGFEA